MRNTQIHLDRLAAALARHRVKLPRTALLEAAAASLGFRNSNDLAAAMRGADGTPPKAVLIGEGTIAGRKTAQLSDPVAGLPYAMARTDGPPPAYGVSPYGNLLDLSCLDQLRRDDEFVAAYLADAMERIKASQAASAAAPRIGDADEPPAMPPGPLLRSLIGDQPAQITGGGGTDDVAPPRDDAEPAAATGGEAEKPVEDWKPSGVFGKPTLLGRIGSFRRRKAALTGSEAEARAADAARIAQLMLDPTASKADDAMLARRCAADHDLERPDWRADCPQGLADDLVRLAANAQAATRLCGAADIARAAAAGRRTGIEELHIFQSVANGSMSVRLAIAAATDGALHAGLVKLRQDRQASIDRVAATNPATRSLMLQQIVLAERRETDGHVARMRIDRLRQVAESLIGMPPDHVGPEWDMSPTWLFERAVSIGYRSMGCREMLSSVLYKATVTFDHRVTGMNGMAYRGLAPKGPWPAPAIFMADAEDAVGMLQGTVDQPTMLDVVRHAYVMHALGGVADRWTGWSIDRTADDGSATCRIDFAP